MVLDTHILLWYAVGDARISPTLRAKIEMSTSPIYISSLSFWEVPNLIMDGEINLPINQVERQMNKMVKEMSLTVVDVNCDIALLASTLTFNDSEPIHRLIAATAYSIKQPLASVDHRYRRLPWLKILS